jgi:hypothetical protein
MIEQNDAYKRAKTRVEAIRGWYVHVIVYVIVNAGLFAIDLATGDGINWAYWPLIGWGIGLAIHTVVVWLEGGPLGRQWEERKIQELLDRDQNASGHPGGTTEE